MDVPAGFVPFPEQGPFLEHIGPVHVREDGEQLVLGLRAEERHANHRGTVQGGLSRPSPTSPWAGRSRPTPTTAATAPRSA